LELELRNKHGKTVICRYFAELVKAVQRTLLLSTAEDITERKQAQEALQTSELKYRRLHETMRDAFVCVDMTGKIQEFNSAYKDMLGYPEAELRQLTYANLTPPKWHTLEASIVKKQIIPRGHSEVYEKEYRRKDGTVFPVELRTYLIKDEAGQPAGMWAIVRDISARKQAQQELRELNATLERRVTERTAELQASEEKFRRLFATVADAVLLIDSQTMKIIEANTAAEELYGYSRKELTGLSAMDLSAQPKASENSLNLALASLPDPNPLRWHRKKDGTIFPVQIAASTFEFQDRLLICGVARDMTRQMELEQEILAAGEMERQRIAQDLHDDLCQQLTGIHYLTETLARNLAEHSRTETVAAKRIAEQVQRTLRQTRELSHGLSPVNLQQEGLAAALNQLCTRTENIFGCQCHFKGSPNLLAPKPATAIHLFRIAQEAVNNALKHGKGNRIDISLAQRHNKLTLRVFDNGSGFSPRRKSGRGMGLSIMQHRADFIGGMLVVRKARHGGTEVICTVNGIVSNSNKGKGK
jgi:two-component system CheB/CheR fusion protein